MEILTSAAISRKRAVIAPGVAARLAISDDWS
jgi:hypothetical protein